MISVMENLIKYLPNTMQTNADFTARMWESQEAYLSTAAAKLTTIFLKVLHS